MPLHKWCISEGNGSQETRCNCRERDGSLELSNLCVFR